MARLYANENFPREVVEALRAVNHGVKPVCSGVLALS